LYHTGLGRGGALLAGDFDPSRAGLEVVDVHESRSGSGTLGSTFRDAATGEILWSVPARKDTGRGAMADIDPRHPGAEGWNVGQEAERSEEHTSELQSRFELVCRLLLEKKKNTQRKRREPARNAPHSAS